MSPTTPWKISCAVRGGGKPMKPLKRRTRSDVMNQRSLAIAVVAAGVLFGAALPLFAHHAFGSEFDPNRPLLLKGKIVRIEWVNPHAWIHMEVANADGSKDVWMIEGGS